MIRKQELNFEYSQFDSKLILLFILISNLNVLTMSSQVVFIYFWFILYKLSLFNQDCVIISPRQEKDKCLYLWLLAILQ